VTVKSQMGAEEDREAVGALGTVGSSRGGKRSEERHRRLLCPKALSAARREERRRGGSPAPRARGRRPTRGATEVGGPTVDNDQVRRRRAAIERRKQRKKSDARGPAVWARPNEQ
jgi:hypothetical protein